MLRYIILKFRNIWKKRSTPILCGRKPYLKLILLTIVGLNFTIFIQMKNGYVSTCDISEEKNNKLRTLIKTVSLSLERYNVTYWIDYGTALGAYRYCDVIPWDHDADIGYLETDYKKVLKAADEVNRQQGFKMNSLIASYGSLTLDLFRWKKIRNWWSLRTVLNFITRDNDTANTDIMYVNMPMDYQILIFFRNFFVEHFPFEFINKRSRVKIANFEVYTMRNLTELVKWRYFLTYDKIIPYNTNCLKNYYNPNIKIETKCQQSVS